MNKIKIYILIIVAVCTLLLFIKSWSTSDEEKMLEELNIGSEQYATQVLYSEETKNNNVFCVYTTDSDNIGVAYFKGKNFDLIGKYSQHISMLSDDFTDYEDFNLLINRTNNIICSVNSASDNSLLINNEKVTPKTLTATLNNKEYSFCAWFYEYPKSASIDSFKVEKN